MYIFDEFQTDRPKGSRRPKINTLYDVFCNIRDDEKEHVSTMAACQDNDLLVRSPNTEAALTATTISLLVLGYLAVMENGPVDQILKELSNIPQLQYLTTESNIDEQTLGTIQGLTADSDVSIIGNLLSSPATKKVLALLSKIWPIFEL
jgi:hypothetical protein